MGSTRNVKGDRAESTKREIEIQIREIWGTLELNFQVLDLDACRKRHALRDRYQRISFDLVVPTCTVGGHCRPVLRIESTVFSALIIVLPKVISEAPV